MTDKMPHKPENVDELLAALQANAAGDFRSAMSLPPAIYHDRNILELECDRLFRRDWVCLGRAAEMPRTGDYICRDIAGTPVFVVRGRDGAIKSFANICRHRASRLLNDCGHVSRISCPYHSWTYDLDGQLIGAPFMQESQDFEVAEIQLQEFACEEWLGFVYVSLAPQATPLSQRLSGLQNLVADYRIEDYVPVFQQEEVWHTNWKCLVENFMDAYHIHRVHRNSFARDGSSEELTELFPGDDAYSYHYVQESESDHSVFAHADNTWLTGADRYRTWLINIFPSHVIQLQPDLLWYLSILPAGIDKVSIRWAVSIPAEILDGATDRQRAIDDVLDLLHLVNSEDRPVVENVFRSTGSPAATQGPLSWLEHNVWQFGRYLARQLRA